jgi:F-type H+-transporting ATPase subunit b
MRRHSFLALGFLTLALLFAPVTRQAFGQDHGAAPAGEHAAPAEPNILELKPSLGVSTLLVFGILLLVLWRFAWGPLAKALHDREHGMEEALHATEHARAEAERLLAEHRGQMAQASEQVRALIDAARRDAQSAADDIVHKAQAEAESTRQRAERDIHTARDQALLEIWTKTADLAVTVAGKVLSRQLSPEDQRRLVEVAQAELPASPNGRGGHAA